MYRKLENYRWLALLLLVPLVWLVMASVFDRTPPFETIRTNSVTNAKAGGTVYFDLAVRRDTDRNCNVEFSRYIVDAKGFRQEVLAKQRYNSAALRKLSKESSGLLLIAVQLPLVIASGPAIMTTALTYRCSMTHMIWPIEVVVDIPFEVLPS